MITFPPNWSSRRVALVHDWLTGMRGGERVLELLAAGFPQATIHTLLHCPSAISAGINAHSIETSWLQRLPGAARWYRYALPLLPLAARSLRPRDVDLVISCSHCVAKSVRPPPGARHVSYVFTPMRYAWTFFDEYFGPHPLKKAALAPLLAALRDWDRRAAERVDTFITLSRHVADRIRRFYGRDAKVVYPPVDTDYFTPDPAAEPGGFDLIVSALVPYKRLDLAVRAYNRLGRPLKIIGVGTETAALRRMAGPHIEFLGRRPDDVVRDHYRRCDCLIFPGEEDFGIVPLEANACGRPVIAFRRGGARETLTADVSGVFFDAQTDDALLAARETARAVRWDPAAIRRCAERFGQQRFIDEFARAIG